jgi:hypothetical protein
MPVYSCVAVSVGRGLLVCASIGLGAEPVYIWTVPPSALAEGEALARTLASYPSYEARWKAHKDVSLTYTVRQYHVGLEQPGPCRDLPIRVRIVDGRLDQATYAADCEDMKAGAPARIDSLYLTPADFFARIVKARDQLRCFSPARCTASSVLRVEYHESYGFPVSMEDSSFYMSDYYWSLKVTDVRRLP